MKKIIFIFLILFASVLKVKGITGTIIIQRYDNENKERLEATLVSSNIGVYKNNGLIAELIIDENGTAKLEGLELGMYTVKERYNAYGYNLSLYTHTVYITEYESTKVVSWGSDVIEGNLIINKYYGEEDNYKLDENAVFEVYHNNKLIKSLKPVNGVIKERLEYGTYTIKQVSGIKYYDLSEEFIVKIEENKDYKYNLYTTIEELNDIVSTKEEELTLKEENLSKLEEELNNQKKLLKQESDRLDKLKEEINIYYSNINNKHNELLEQENLLNEEQEKINQEQEKLRQLKEEIDLHYLNLENKKKDLNEKEKDLNILKSELNIFDNALNEKVLVLKTMEFNIKKREEEVEISEKEIELLSQELKEKENKLINLEKSIKSKELELKSREQSIIKLQNKEEENVLVVEVPNTHKKNYNKLISKIMIVIGIILIILSKRKVTNH